MFSKETYMNICGPVSRAVAWAWVIFTTLYFFLSLTVPMIVQKSQDAVLKSQTAVLNDTFQKAQVDGYNKAFLQLGEVLQKQVEGGCKEAIPVNVGTGSIGVVNTACLQNGQQAPAPQPAK